APQRAAQNRRPDKSEHFQSRATRTSARTTAAPGADGLNIPVFPAKKGRRENAGGPQKPLHFGTAARTQKAHPERRAAYPR
ncbi:MAG: hypothetical protein ACRECP_01520, partial [Methylocella sp.]